MVMESTPHDIYLRFFSLMKQFPHMMAARLHDPSAVANSRETLIRNVYRVCQAFRRWRAAQLRGRTRRLPDSSIIALPSRCVMVRDTVSMVRPR